MKKIVVILAMSLAIVSCKNEKEVTENKVEDIKEENKNLGKRLERIEEMLSHLVESKK